MHDMAVNRDGILELIDQTDLKHADAHKRLRDDFAKFEERVDDALKLFSDRQQSIMSRLSDLVNTPVDITKVVATPKIIIGIVVTIVSVFGGVWAVTSDLRSDVRDILTRMQSEQRVTDANAKLLELNNATINRALESNARELKDSIAAVNKRQELLQLQYAQLNDQMTRLMAQRSR